MLMKIYSTSDSEKYESTDQTMHQCTVKQTLKYIYKLITDTIINQTKHYFTKPNATLILGFY